MTPHAPPVTPRETALLLHQHRITPVPVPFREKDPKFGGWQKFTFDPADVDRHFPQGREQNVATLNGERSGGLADADLDCPEAVRAASCLLPTTTWRFGRKSAPNSHWLFRTATAFPSAHRKFHDPLIEGDERRSVLCELIGTGGISVAPSSTHRETGELVRWDALAGEPAEVPLGLLVDRVVDVAVVSLLGRYWPAKGRRDDAFHALAGALARSLEVIRAERIFDTLATITDDEEAGARVKKVQRAADRLEADEKTIGWPTLAKLLGDCGDKIVKQIREWLGLVESARPRGGAKQATRYRPLPPWRPFPLHTLPPVMREHVEAASASIGCDPALVALPELAAVAAAVGNSRALTLKKGWSEPIALWTLPVAESGGQKSPAFRAAVGPLQELQIDLDDSYRDALERHEEEVARWKETAKESRGEKPEGPEEPPRFMTSDATIEALSENLRGNPRGVLLARDELDGWFQSFTKYKGKGGGSDRSQWLELHSAGSLVVDRLSREQGRLVVRRALASVTGTIQPAVLQQALDKQALAAGLGARFLFGMPPKMRRVWNENELDDAVAGRYQNLLASLLLLELDDVTKRKPHFLGLSPPAKRLWVAFYNEWGGVQHDAEGEQAAAFSKIEAYAARLMLLHHVVAHVAAGVDDRRAVTEASAAAGIEMARWFARESQRIYAMLSETEDERTLRGLIEYVARHGGRMSVRDLQKSNSRKYPDSAAAHAVLEALVRDGYGIWEDHQSGPQGGRPPEVFKLTFAPDTTDRTSSRDDGPDDPPSDTTSDTSPPGGDFPPENAGSGGSVGSVGGNFNNQDASGGRSPAEELKTPNEVLSGASGPDLLKGRAVNGYRSVGKHKAPDTTDKTAFVLIRKQQEVEYLLAALEEADAVALDVETTGLDPTSDRVRLLQLAVPTTDCGHAAYLIDCFAIDPSPVLAALAGKHLLGHNLNFDLAFLARLGFEPSGAVHDTLHLSRVLYAGEGFRVRHGLADCARRELGEAMDKAQQRSDWSGTLSQAQLSYAARDVLVLPRLLNALKVKLKEAGLERTAEIETRCLPALAWVTAKGVAVDRDGWSALVRHAEAEAARLKQEMTQLAPVTPGEMFAAWKWDSPADMKRLFVELGCQIENTNDATLATVAHPIAGLLRQYREATKRLGTYGKGWLKNVRADGRVYARWNQTGSEAGRMSCSGPNMQQLPRDRAYRRCVAAPPGRVLVKADYSQIELRIAAKVSGDEALLKAYRDGSDVHTQTAQRVLGKQEVTKEDRQLAKALNFGLLYGMGAQSFAANARSEYGIELTEEQASAYRDAFFRAYPGLMAWHRRVKRQQAAETRTLAGRRRVFLPPSAEKSAEEKKRYEAAMNRQRLNTPVQGTGACGLKRALALLWERRDEAPGAFPVLVVHDEIVVECDEAQAEAVSAWLRRAMCDAMAPLVEPVPVEVEVKVGKTWGG